MGDLLVLANTPDDIQQLTELGESKGLRVKATLALKIALSWLKLRKYDLACVHATVSIAAQQELAGLLWELNPRARLIVYDLGESVEIDRNEMHLFGAESIKGAGALQNLAHALELRPLSGPQNNADFRIMVVEDLDSPRDIICFFLESMGFPSVTGFRSAREAIAELNKRPDYYSCVITDIKMPEMSGQALIEQVRGDKQLQHIPVVVLTAYGTVDCLVDCLKAGASGFLVKPPKKRDLTRELARATRIISGEASPRLVTAEEAESVKEVLARRGITEGW